MIIISGGYSLYDASQGQSPVSAGFQASTGPQATPPSGSGGQTVLASPLTGGVNAGKGIVGPGAPSIGFKWRPVEVPVLERQEEREIPCW